MTVLWTPQNIDVQSFSEWLDRSEIFQAPYSVKTRRVYLSVVAGLLVFMQREQMRVFAEFNTAWVRRFASRNPETDESYSPSYQTLRVAALNLFWVWLIELGAATENPVAQLLDERRHDARARKPAGGNRPKRLPEVLGWEEQRGLLATVQQSEGRTSVRDYALVTFILASGIRCEELCTLRLPNLDLTHSRVRVIGKGNKERIVDFSHDPQRRAVGALQSWLLDREDLLRRRREEADMLFISVNGKPMTGSLIYQQVAKYLREAGLDGMRQTGPHLLRHTATSIMFALNVPVLQIQANLGHEQLTTTQIYAHLLPQEILPQAAVV